MRIVSLARVYQRRIANTNILHQQISRTILIHRLDPAHRALRHVNNRRPTSEVSIRRQQRVRADVIRADPECVERPICGDSDSAVGFLCEEGGKLGLEKGRERAIGDFVGAER